jgi:hypothetical protein
MDRAQLFAVYKLWLQYKALELGMPDEAASIIPQLRTGPEVLALVDFLVHSYGADYISLQPWIKKPQPCLYLAEDEHYNEWEAL